MAAKHTLMRVGNAPRDLEDITHEVFLRVYKHWHAYDPSRAVRPSSTILGRLSSGVPAGVR